MSLPIDFTYADYTETLRCSAEERKCDACKEPIIAGHCYYDIDITVTEADDWGDGLEEERLTRCVRCQRIHEHLRTLAPFEMWPDECLACGEEYTEHWGKEPPPEIAELAFVDGAALQTPEMQARALSKGQFGGS